MKQYIHRQIIGLWLVTAWSSLISGPVYDAVKVQDYATLNRLLNEEKQSPDDYNDVVQAIRQETALLRAVELHDPQLVAILLDAGASLEIPFEQQLQPIILAFKNLLKDPACKELHTIIRLFAAQDPQLTFYGSQPGVVDGPLHVIATHVDHERALHACRWILEEFRTFHRNRGLADFCNSTGYAGSLPLHDAIHQGNLELIRLFMRHGADFDRETPYAENAYDAAVKAGNPDIITYIEQVMLAL